MQPVIATAGLSKSYGAVAALTDLDLTVRPGEIYGLVGRNGAGKTTLMRLLLGLLTPTAGTVAVFGRPAGDPGALARVGALVESPALYPHLSGRDNLRLLGLYSGVGPAAVDDALARVGLGERAGSRFSTYSLGMKQRLGVAAALLGDPDLLILDEPTNGLDPGAMAEFRDLLRGVRDEGRTVLLSSHLLGEVEQVCDRIGVVHDGRLVVEGTIEEIHASASGGGRTIAVRAEPADAAVAVLRAAAGVRSASADGAIVTAVLDGLSIGDANRTLVEAGVEVSELRPVRRSLEDVFLGLTAVDADTYLAGVGAASDDRIGALA